MIDDLVDEGLREAEEDLAGEKSALKKASGMRLMEGYLEPA